MNRDILKELIYNCEQKKLLTNPKITVIDLMDLKVFIDRWDRLTEHFIINESYKKEIKQLTSPIIIMYNEFYKINSKSMWGIDFTFTDKVPFIICALTDDAYNSLLSGTPVDYNQIFFLYRTYFICG